MAESRHSTGSAPASADAEAAAEADASGAALAVALDDGSAPASAEVSEPPPKSEPSSHHSATRTVITTRTMAPRRIQYTDAGSGPVGCISELTGTTLLRAPFDRETIPPWRRTAGEAADAALVRALIRWFDVHERPLPWRSTTPWGVLVSEFMLQQTPVDRVLPVWPQWMERWPTPADLAAAPMGDALRAWGRLGYPRRAQRLHQSAVVITDAARRRGSRRTRRRCAQLPGVGDYTAAAILAFAFDRRSIVLDTNVRRVLSRTLDGGRPGPAAHHRGRSGTARTPCGRPRTVAAPAGRPP